MKHVTLSVPQARAVIYHSNLLSMHPGFMMMARDLQTCANKLEKLYRRPVSFFAEDIEDLLFGGVLHKFLNS